jgi:hypothetical protein
VKPLPPRADPPPPTTPTPPPASRARQQVAGIVVGSLGVVLVGVGTGFGVDAASKLSRSNAAGHCDAQSFCDDAGLALRHDAIGSATISSVGFIAGGALLAGGVILVLTAPAAAGKIDVALAPGSLGISGSF